MMPTNPGSMKYYIPNHSVLKCWLRMHPTYLGKTHAKTVAERSLEAYW